MDYEPLYLAGVRLFNQREFFDTHEVLEDLWNECLDRDRKFYQGLLQAAVALYHFEQGNLRGAVKLFRTGRAYMEQYPTPYLGLDRARFWDQMAACFAPVHAEPDLLRRDLRPGPEQIPTITLDPEPVAWPDPAAFLHEEESRDSV